MIRIISYLKDYIKTLDKLLFLIASSFTAGLIFLNYHFGLNDAIYDLPDGWQYAAWYLIFFVAFSFCYVTQFIVTKTNYFKHLNFVLLLLIAPAVFSWKMSFAFDVELTSDVLANQYWNAVMYWPFKVVVVTALLFIIHYFFDKQQDFYGVTTKNFPARPYLLMLLLMVPLIAAASTQKDFLSMYPRMQNVAYLTQPGTGFNKLLYELAYGSDFFP